MKTAKSIVLAILLGLSVASNAQPSDMPDMTARWEKLAKVMNLDDSQSETFLSVMKTQDEKMRSYHEETKIKMEELKAQTLSALSDTLTSDQLEQLENAMTRPERNLAPPRQF